MIMLCTSPSLQSTFLYILALASTLRLPCRLHAVLDSAPTHGTVSVQHHTWHCLSPPLGHRPQGNHSVALCWSVGSVVC